MKRFIVVNIQAKVFIDDSIDDAKNPGGAWWQVEDLIKALLDLGPQAVGMKEDDGSEATMSVKNKFEESVVDTGHARSKT